MKRIFTLTFLFTCVLYLSSMTFGQGKGGNAPGGAPEATHSQYQDRDIDHNKTQGKTDAREDSKEPFIDRIQENPQLSTKLNTLLQKSGWTMGLSAAAMGFKNEGQFIAAVHVANNLGIPFASLRTKVMGPPPMKLGQAIHALKPDLSAKDVDQEADKAEKEAKVDERMKSVTKPVS